MSPNHQLHIWKQLVGKKVFAAFVNSSYEQVLCAKGVCEVPPHFKQTGVHVPRVTAVINDGVGTVGREQHRSQDRRCEAPTPEDGPSEALKLYFSSGKNSR